MRRRGVESGGVSAYPIIRLGDVADVVAGDPAPQKPEAFSSDGPLFVRMRDVGRDHLNPALSLSMDRLDPEWLGKNRLRLFPKDSILIPKSGVSVNLNHRAMLATDAYVVSHLAVVIPDHSKVEPNYLFWWAVRYDPRKQVQVTSLPSLKLSTLKSAEIPLPPLAEQRRIAGILNRAARIERLQARATDRIHTFTLALFVKMFDNLSGNDTSGSVPLDDLSVSLESGFACGKSKLVEDGMLHLRPFNIGSNGELYLKNTYKIPHSFASKSKSFVHSGDILFNNTNSRDLVGKVALVHENLEAGFSNHITRIRLDQTRCEPTFLTGYLRYLWQHGFFRDRCTQWVSQAAYGPRLLARMPIPIPPLAVQRQFTDICKQAAGIANNARSASKAASALTASLMDRLLDGDPAPGRAGGPGPA